MAVQVNRLHAAPSLELVIAAKECVHSIEETDHAGQCCPVTTVQGRGALSM
jgi:hypothetical protein